ncbi:MAG: hypothetical protein K2K92_01810 [Duncaniella sp.]|nr:hypothetical protein [Duncaniella sp.]
MESIETLIPDNEGNHLVVVLSFYEDYEKTGTFLIPHELAGLDIADISIKKLDSDKPLNIKAFFKMCQWLIEQFMMFPNAVFSFICSTDPLVTNHSEITPERYRWNLFDCLYKRNITRLQALGVMTEDIIVGPDGYQTFARVFYRTNCAAVIYLVANHLDNKYSE